jgi:hypothetical protein
LTVPSSSPKTSRMLTARKIQRAWARDLQLVSVILLAVQLLSLAHLLSARHITCPEHGDIMHVESSTGKMSSGSASDAEVPLRPALASSESTASPEHHHCLVCAEANRRCLLAGPTQMCIAPVLVVGSAHAIATASFAPIELLLLSPKNSPPSA